MVFGLQYKCSKNTESGSISEWIELSDGWIKCDGYVYTISLYTEVTTEDSTIADNAPVHSQDFYRQQFLSQMSALLPQTVSSDENTMQSSSIPANKSIPVSGSRENKSENQKDSNISNQLNALNNNMIILQQQVFNSQKIIQDLVTINQQQAKELISLKKMNTNK